MKFPLSKRTTNKLIIILFLIFYIFLVLTMCSKLNCGDCNSNQFNIKDTVHLRSNNQKVIIKNKNKDNDCCTYTVYFYDSKNQYQVMNVMPDEIYK